MNMLNRMKTTPVQAQRTTRRHDLRVLTSLPAGKLVPLAAVPLLREDSVTRLNARIQFEMSETVEMLMNAVNVRVTAYAIPNLAFDRFSGMDELNRSYQGVANQDNGAVTPYFETMAAPAHGANAIFKYMGKHARPGTTINTAYIEAYNKVWNFRAKNRSPEIAQRDKLDSTLAPAFWLHQGFAHIVPDFDQALVDGEVALNVVNSKMPVKGLGILGDGTTTRTPVVRSVFESGETGAVNRTGLYVEGSGSALSGSETHLFLKTVGTTNALHHIADVWAELQDNGITVSLSNLEMARRTQAFANLRRQYNGHPDEYIVDLLMDAIAVPEQAYKNPMLLADQHTIFGMSKRYASDAANLTESVVNGETVVDVSFAVPRMNCGGVIMLFAEITPEQMFERQKDPYLHVTTPEKLPALVRDTLDPEKVVAVPCEYVDLDHDTPTATFGYAPLNHEWTHTAPQIGGRFYRPAVDASFDEDRQRLWAVETQNPVLSADFYLCTTMHTKPFVVTNIDPFEAVLRGEALIRGNTVFGGALIEATNDYAEVLEEAPQERIAK